MPAPAGLTAVASRVVLVRHGETAWSREHRHTGLTDLPLTGEGERQARALVPRLSGQSFSLVLTSPLTRARETCRLSGVAGSVQVVDDLREWDHGIYEGRSTRDIRREVPGWDVWRGPVPEGESSEDVAVRADRVIARLDATEGPVAVFAHGHLLRALGVRWIGLPASAGGRLALSTAAVCELSGAAEARVIERWNDTAHLTSL